VAIQNNDNDGTGLAWIQDRDNFYAFLYAEQDGGCSVVKVKGGAREIITGSIVRPCPNVARRGQFDSFRFQITRETNTSVRLRGYVRGTSALNIVDTDAIEGAFAPAMYNVWSTNVRYDNFRVWERTASCENGILDGNERFIDCGGACTPCNQTVSMQLDFASPRDRRGWSEVTRTANGGIANWNINSG